MKKGEWQPCLWHRAPMWPGLWRLCVACLPPHRNRYGPMHTSLCQWQGCKSVDLFFNGGKTSQICSKGPFTPGNRRSDVNKRCENAKSEENNCNITYYITLTHLDHLPIMAAVTQTEASYSQARKASHILDQSFPFWNQRCGNYWIVQVAGIVLVTQPTTRVLMSKNLGCKLWQG